MSRARIAAFAVLAVLLPVPAALAAEPGDATPGRTESAAEIAKRSVEACGRPALSPGLPIRRKVRPVQGVSRKQLALAKMVSALGERANASARAQAIAVAVALAGDMGQPAQARRFYRKLRGTPRWEGLPPTIAAHRALGTPDPFAYEGTWQPALKVLSALAASKVVDIDNVVSSGASAPQRCHLSGANLKALPLPAGTTYSVTSRPGTTKVAEPTPTSTPTATTVSAVAPRVEFRAPCGTPVKAVTSGVVEVEEGVTDAGPWLITVRQGAGGTATSFAHVRAPVVADGDVVFAGQQLAEVGDLGDVQRCALGLSVTTGKGAARGPIDPVRWLAAGLAAAEASLKLHLPETDFRIATFNVLGAHLTGPGADRPDYAPGPGRMVRALAQVEAADASVAVFNEFETPQANVVLADGDWDLHRATPNNTFRDGNTSGNAVAWRKDTWRLVATDELAVPWDVTLHMPVVSLEHRRTRARIRVMGVHNPASTDNKGDQSGARARATALELEMVATLLSDDPGTPLLVAGDLNDRSEAFCTFTSGGYLRAAPGGSVGPACSPPRYGQVDWILGSLDVSFSGLAVGAPSKAVSDHPMVSTGVSLPARTVAAARWALPRG